MSNNFKQNKTVAAKNHSILLFHPKNVVQASTFRNGCKLILGAVLFLLTVLELGAQAPTLGTYPNTSIQAGQSTNITPGAAPTNTTSLVAYTQTLFTGIFHANPATGVLSVTDAKQAGVFTVMLKAFGPGGTTTTTFTLTVTDPNCSQGLFAGTLNVSAGTQPLSVAIGDFNGDGEQDLAAANSVSNTVSIRMGDGLGGFAGGSNVAVGATPHCVAIGDFNGDGKQDFATANQFSNNVSIRLGDGLGGFSVATNVSVGSQPFFVVIGDFNGDGKQDLAIANSGANSISIRIGDGLGGFSGVTSVAVGSNPTSLTIGDFNGDGKQDFAAGNFSLNTLSVSLGDGLGGFAPVTSLTVGSNPSSVAIGDFNADGKQDLAATNYISNTVSICLGNGIGGFGAATSVSIGTNPYSVAIGDFNGDGKQDFAAANFGTNDVSIRLGDGLGGFAGTSSIAVGTNPYSVAIGDFNADGKLDFAAANQNSNNVSIRMGGENEINMLGNAISIADGDITPSLIDHTDFGSVVISTPFARTYTISNTGNTSLTVGAGAITVSGADASMFVVSGITLPATIAAGASTNFAVTFTPTSTGLKTATVTIANDDCNEAVYDFAVQGNGAPLPTLGVYANTSVQAGKNVTITPSSAPTNTTYIVAYTHTSFTGVFHVDPVTGVLSVSDAKQAGVYTVTVKATGPVGGAGTATFTLTVTDPNCSQGRFVSATPLTAGTNPRNVTIGDFNGDGNQDMATANFGSANLSIRLGDGLGGFGAATTVAVGTNPNSIGAGDFNGDGKQDLAVTNEGSNNVSIRLGDGLGGFTLTSTIAVGVLPRGIALGDFNGDGKQDFAAANFTSSTVSIRLGDGLGGFSGTTNIAVGSNPSSVAIGDFNADGNQDFVATNQTSNNVSISLGDGLGGFAAATTVAVGTSPVAIAIGDFNADGKQDIVTANNGSASASICLGDGLGGFGVASSVAVGTTPRSIAIGDFNGDGKQDFAAANFGSNNISVRLGDGLGGFVSAANVAVGTNPYSAVVGDFNEDGKNDLATANNTSNNVSVVLGGANEIDVQGNAISIADGDVTPSLTDHTDFGSVALSSPFARTFTIRNTGTTSLILNAGAITITGTDASMFVVSGITLPATIAGGGSTTFVVTFTPTSLGLKTATVNIANDDCDEAASDFAVQGLGIALPGLGIYPGTSMIAGTNITISPGAVPTSTNSAVAYTTTPFTGVFHVNPSTGVVSITDARQAGVYTVTVKAFGLGGGTATTTFVLTVNNPNCSQGLFTNATNVSSGVSLESAAIGDFNGDGKQDFAVANSSSDAISIRLGDGLGGFAGATSVATEISPRSVAIGDFNGDGKQDFAASNFSSSTVSIRMGDGLGGFSGVVNTSVGTQPSAVAIGDFNGDGRQDMATANTGSNSVSIRLGDGGGGFSGVTSVAVGSNPIFIAIGDFNADNRQDLATANYNSNDVSIRLGDGFGGFALSTTIAVGGLPRSIAIGDFNADGKQDIAVANSGSNTISIRMGNGVGGFTGTTNVAVGTLPYSVAIGDFNGDGKQDFAAANSTANTVSIRMGDGLGGFAGTTNMPVGTNPYAVVIGDFNTDGRQDFASANFGSANVSVCLSGINEIGVKGNSISIADGDATPAAADHTDFGSASVCAGTIVRTFTIENSGTTTLLLTGVSLSGAGAPDYSVSTPPASSVAPGGSTTFNITFNPSLPGARNAIITVVNDDCDEATYDFAITGNGTDPEVSVTGNLILIADGDAFPSTPDGTDFGNQGVCVGTVIRSFKILNNGTSNLTISGVTISGAAAADFSVTTAPAASVVPTDSTLFQVSFNPSVSGIRNATLTINSNDCDEAAYDLAITGTGVDPEVNVLGNSVAITDGDVTPSTGDHTDFGSLTFCTGTMVRTFTIKNLGSADLSVTSVTVTGPAAADFNVSSPPAATVTAGGLTTFDITFDPSVLGARNATITIVTDDCDESVYDFAITGNGAAGGPVPAITVFPSDQIICEGLDASFTGDGSGGGLTYQWQEDSGSGFVNLVASATYLGVTTSSLTVVGVTPGMSGNVYQCVISNACGNNTTPPALLTVLPKPTVTTPPVPSSVCDGSTVNYNVGATGDGLTYQWQEDAGSGFLDIISAGIYSGATSGTLTITGVSFSMSGYFYRCIVSGTCLPPDTSAAALLTIFTPATVGVVMDSVSCFGGSDGGINQTLTGTPPFNYIWSTGATTQDVSLLGAGSYSCTITDGNGCLLDTAYTVSEPTAIASSGIVTHNACAGLADGCVDLTVSGGTPGYSYLWDTGETVEDPCTLTPGVHTVIVTDAHGCSDTLAFTILASTPLPVSITHAGDSLIANGGSFTSYQWYDEFGAPIAGETNMVYYYPLAGDTVTFIVMVTDSNLCSSSDTITIIITGNEPATNLQQMIQLYPVPAHGTAWVASRSLIAGAVSISVIGMNGAVVLRNEVRDWREPVALDLSRLAAGVYAVRVETVGGVWVGRLVVE